MTNCSLPMLDPKRLLKFSGTEKIYRYPNYPRNRYLSESEKVLVTVLPHYSAISIPFNCSYDLVVINNCSTALLDVPNIYYMLFVISTFTLDIILKN